MLLSFSNWTMRSARGVRAPLRAEGVVVTHYAAVIEDVVLRRVAVRDVAEQCRGALLGPEPPAARGRGKHALGRGLLHRRRLMLTPLSLAYWILLHGRLRRCRLSLPPRSRGGLLLRCKLRRLLRSKLRKLTHKNPTFR